MNAYILSWHLNWDILIAYKHSAAKKTTTPILSLDIKFLMSAGKNVLQAGTSRFSGGQSLIWKNQFHLLK